MKLRLLFFCISCLIILFNNGCAIKYGIYNIKDPYTAAHFKSKNYFAFETFTPALWNRVDLSLGGEYKKSIEEHISLNDIHATLNYYPFKINITSERGFIIKPYVGAGVGLFHYSSSSYKQFTVARGTLYYSNPGKHIYYSIAEGFYPNGVIGAHFLLDDYPWIRFLVEYKMPINKSDRIYNFNGSILSFGLRFIVSEF